MVKCQSDYVCELYWEVNFVGVKILDLFYKWLVFFVFTTRSIIYSTHLINGKKKQLSIPNLAF